MARGAYLLKAATVAAAISMIASPVAASVQASASGVGQINAAQVDPLVAFSLYGSPDSRMALCGMRSTDAATGVAAGMATSTASTTAQGQANSGCVLPLRDAAPIAAESAGLAPGYGGFPPILFLAAGGALAMIFAILKGDGDGQFIRPTPISPA